MGYTTKEIMELMEKAAELKVSVEVSDSDFSVNIDGRGVAPLAAPQAAQSAVFVEATAVAAPAPCEPARTGTEVKSPIVGTFYLSPAPDKPAFVAAGQAVKKGDVLFIVESMKLMNEVQSEFDGTVKEILLASGAAVEYGQTVLVLE